jgi:urea transport system substrate-binding protein
MITWSIERRVVTKEEAEELDSLAKESIDGLLIAAQEMRERLGPNSFKDFMGSIFRDKTKRPSDVHGLLSRLPFAAVLTSNYDKLLEAVYFRTGRLPSPVYTQNNIPNLATLMSMPRFYILKVHGDIDDIETVVLGKSDYGQLLNSNAPYRSTLEQLFQTMTVLFIGCSLTDPDTLALLNELRTIYRGHGPTHYAFTEMANANSIRCRRFEKDYGIQIIPYEPSDKTHPEVVLFLNQLKDEVSKWSQEPVQTVREETVKVGVLHSLTGTMASSEQPLVDAVLMAIDEINIDGGILGRRIEAIIEDGASDESTFARKMEKLLLEDKVCSVFGCWTSASRKAVLPILERERKLLWYPVQYEGYESSPYVIYSGAAPNQQILPAVDWCLNRSWKKMFLVGSDYVFPRTANKIVKAHLSNHGGVCVGEEYLPLGQWKGVQDIAAKIKKAQPDVIFNTINGDSNVPFYRQLAEEETNLKRIPVIAVSIAEVELRLIGTKFMSGHYCAWCYFQSIDTPENRKFVEAFKRKYGTERVTSDPIEAAYMQVHLFAETVKKAGSFDVDQIRKTVGGMRFDAPGGPVCVDPENQHVWTSARIGEIQPDGQFKIVWSSDKWIQPNPYPYPGLVPETRGSSNGKNQEK